MPSPPFTLITITQPFLYADGTLPGPDSFLEFTPTVPWHNTVTGRAVPAGTVTAPLDANGGLTVILYATDDPTTAPTGASYHVVEHIVRQTPRRYYISVPYTTTPVLLSSLVPGDTAPPVGYGLTQVSVPAPLLEVLTAGVAVVTWDGSGALGDVLTKTGTGPAVYGFAAPTGGGSSAPGVFAEIADFTCAAVDAALYVCDTDTAAASITATLPAPTAGRLLLFVRNGADDNNALTLLPTGGALINRETTWAWTGDGATGTFYADGTDWRTPGLSVTDGSTTVLGVTRLNVDSLSDYGGGEIQISAVPAVYGAPGRADVAGGAAGDAGAHGYTPGDHQHVLSAAYLHTAQDLSDLADAPTARTNLGLGTAAVTNTGTGATNTILGNDARLTDARPPGAHATTHAGAGSDPVTPAAIGASATGHSHAESDTTGLVTDLAGKSATGHTHTHASTTGQTADDHHPKSHVHTGDGSGTVAYSSLSGTPVTFAPSAHASSHLSTGADAIAGAVAGGASGLLTGTDKTKLDGIAAGAQVGTVTSVGLSVPGVLFSVSGVPITGAGTAALTLLTQPANRVLAGPASGADATPTLRALVAADLPATAARTNADNAFTAGQGVRAALGTNADGLYVPWVTGDSHPTARIGASTSGNNQTGLQVNSDSGTAISGSSASNIGITGNSATSVGVQGVLSGAGTTPLEGRYTGSSVSGINLLILRNNTSGTGGTTTGGLITFIAKTDTTLGRTQADVGTSWGGSATEGAQKARVLLRVYDTAAREAIRLEASGTAPMVGFLGANAAIRQTVAAAATDAATTQTLANSLRTILVTYGLAV